MESGQHTYATKGDLVPDRELTLEEWREYFKSDNAKVAASLHPEWALGVILMLLDKMIAAKNRR